MGGICIKQAKSCVLNTENWNCIGWGGSCGWKERGLDRELGDISFRSTGHLTVGGFGNVDVTKNLLWLERNGIGRELLRMVVEKAGNHGKLERMLPWHLR